MDKKGNINIGIVGTRRRNTVLDFQCVENEFKEIYQINDTIVSGGCPQGADHFAPILAKKYEVNLIVFYPKWKLYKKSAGFKRNTLIAKESDVLIACVADDRTGGTEDTIRKFLSKIGGSSEEKAIENGELILV